MATLLSSKAVGSIVKLKENGVLQEYIVVHQGLPSSMYDSSCNGTWLLRKTVTNYEKFDSGGYGVYETSSLHEWLNNSMIDIYESAIQAKIQQVKIPYEKNGNNGTIQSGSNGLTCKIFLLSGYEVGLTTSVNSGIPIDGAKLDYFETGTGSSADSKRSTGSSWLLRSSCTNTQVYFILSNGVWANTLASDARGVRQTIVLPNKTVVNSDNSICAPTIPLSIAVPSTIYANKSISISWGTSTTVDGNLSGYILEREYDGNGIWTQLYKGYSTSYSTSVSSSYSTVKFRVKAYDTSEMESNPRTSNSYAIKINTAPTIPSSITVSTAIDGKTLDISWTASTDAQGDTIQYQLERSTNGGSFSKIYDGTETTYKDTVLTSWNTVQYRVRAYDTQPLYSAYKTSESNTVLHLTISNITAPAGAMIGQSIPINWSSAVDATSYTLERKADSGQFESIYTGSDTSYTDTVGEWTSVVYRVKAEKSGNFGDYKTATAVSVVPSSAIAISGTDSDLGTLTKDVPYTVSSDTGNKISLERYVNGQLVSKIQVNSGFLYTIPVVDLPTGTGTIKLVATVNTSASLPVSETRTWTYTKQVVNLSDSGGVSTLEQDGKNIFPTTLCEAVRVPTVWGGSLDKALEMLLPIVNMAVMAVGSYVGSGTFGKDNPNSITLDFTPQMVIISGGNKSLNISNTLKTGGETAGYIENKKVTWYSTSADAQLNTSEVTYTYIAIGKQEQT